MVWTKEEVDKYVVQVERNCPSPRERNLKGFAFARLYIEASDHDNARRYLAAYISESEGDFRGHSLMGQLYEENGLFEKAVASYRRSLELNNTQKELVLKVVKLYCRVPVHPDRARAWADRGARLFPGHPDVFCLRVHLVESAENVDFEALEDLISEEVSNRPHEVHLHVKLVRLYAVRGRLNEAFSHCVAVMKTKAFKDNLEWYACCVEIFEKYVASLEKHLIDGQVIGSGHTILEVHSFLLIALGQFLEQHLSTCDMREVINVLYRLDHCLFLACSRKIRHSPRRVSSAGMTEWEVVLAEMKAQLYMHCGTLVIRLAKEKFVTWPRGLKLACACYLASLGISEPETKAPWVARAPKHKDPLKWYIMACSRLSHIGHFLMATSDRHGVNWLNTCCSDCCSRQGQEEILTMVYRREKDLTKSFLASSGEFVSTESTLPEVDQLVAWDEVALRENPRSLQSLTWVGLHWYQYDKEMRPGVGVMVKDIFQDLRMDVPNIEKHITPNMLCWRDLESFLYAVVRSTAARILEDRDVYYEDFEPRVLPQPLCSSLSLPVQDEWWIAAYNLYTGKFNLSESGKTRRIVQLGIEKIRALDLNHGLPVQLLVYLAKAFGSKASFLKSSGPNPWYYEEHWKSLEKWSLHYWQKAVTILEMLEKDESIPHCGRPLFPQLFDKIQEAEVTLYLQSARLVLGGAAMQGGRIEEAMELFEQVKTSRGMFNLAQIYKYLAHVEARAATEETDTEGVGPAREYYQNLKKARELLLASLKMTDSTDVARQTMMDELREIESMIRIGVSHANSKPSEYVLGQHLHQLSDPESSTYASDVQESEDNFWEEKPQDSSTKDLIAKLSEVTLNNGYLQEQMAIRDETMATMSDQISVLQDQLYKLQAAYLGYSTLHGPTVPDQSSSEENKPIFESTPVAVRQTSGIRGPRTNSQSAIKGPLKIDASFFAGLSTSNSPEVRGNENQEQLSSPMSPVNERHDSSTSYGEEIHFEPLIPLPEKIEVQTGEEDEEVMFSGRAKLYRFDKDVPAWKERGIGTLKILHNLGKHRYRILMRREIVHKICANHFITAEMKLTEKKGTANSWMWNTFADFSDEVSKPEQLAVKFKTEEDSIQFKDVLEKCQNILKTETVISLENAPSVAGKGADILAKFAPEPGSWSCSVCLVTNEKRTTVCVACGAIKISEDVKITSCTWAPASVLFSSHQPLPLFGFPTSSSGSTFTLSGLQQTTLPPSGTFAFGASVMGNEKQREDVTKSTFTFIAPDSSVLPGPVSGGQAFGSSSGVPPSTISSCTQPLVSSSFKLASSNNETKVSLGSVGNASASPFSRFSPSFSTSFPLASTNKVSTSVFGGSTGQPASISFGAFGTGNSPGFNLDLSSSGTQTDSLISEKHKVQNRLAQDDSSKPVSQPSFSHSSTVKSGMPEQKLFWENPTGSFQFGQLEEIPPLGGAANLWQPPVSAAGSVTFSSSAGSSTPFVPTTYPQGEASLPMPHLQKELPPKPNIGFSSSELLRRLVFAKTQQESSVMVAGNRGSDFTPYIVDEPALPNKETSLFKETKLVSTLPVDDYDSESNENQITDTGNSVETDSSTEETSSYASSETEDNLGDIEHEVESAMQKTATHTSHILPSVLPNQQPVTGALSRPMPLHSIDTGKPGPVSLSSQITGRRFLTARSPLRGPKKQDDECVLVYEVRPSRNDRDRATYLMLPTNFFNYAKSDSCPGCGGCQVKAADTQKLASRVLKDRECIETPLSQEPTKAAGAGHVFGQFSDSGQLSFSSFRSLEGSNFSEKLGTPKSFSGAGTQLFAEDNEDKDRSILHFEPVIPLPDEIQVVTGEEGQDVLFVERAKLYRFDNDSGQWKERGVGDIKLLRHPRSGQGRVLMRREQIKKVCANHNITSGMELKPNVGSDRSWVWYTAADYAGDEPRAEKLAIKFKDSKTAVSFKNTFDNLRDSVFVRQSSTSTEEEIKEQQENKCTLYEHFATAFMPGLGSWTCETCDVQNKAEHSTCEACGSPKTTEGPPATNINAADAAEIEVVTPKSVEGTKNEEREASLGSASKETSFSSLLKGAPLFTIGRGGEESHEEKADDEVMSPSKISSPSKLHTSLEKPSTPPQQGTPLTGLPFGSNTPAKFTFSLELSPGSPSHGSSSSPASPFSPDSPVHGGDDGLHFEPLIPLPEKIECRSGEEDEQVLFCDRCKLFRYDGDTSQWKERGVGDIKILYHSAAGRYRVLMRREHVFKLCANHSVSSDTSLKPFPNSDKAWLWNTPADFSDEVAKAETLAARFRTRDIAEEFRDVFDKVLQTLAAKPDSGGPTIKPASNTLNGETVQRHENDVLITYEQGVTRKQKERAFRLQLPETFFMYENHSSEAHQHALGTVTGSQDKTACNNAKQEADTPSRKSNFLFGSASVASLSFQSVANTSLGTSPFGLINAHVSPGFVGAGSKLFTSHNPGDDTGTTGDDTDGPQFEPVIPLPDKIEVKTGEEGEEVLFSHRAKLYRFVAEDKQWKDRGVGDLKLLKNKESGRMRVLMRRDQVKKLCANHQITEDMRLQPNAGSDRSWVWSTLADFSEQECRAEQLAVRFKTEEIANQFKEKFEQCQEMLKQQKPEAPKGDLTENPPSTFQKPEAPIGDLTENPPSTFQKPEAPNGNTTENPPLTLQKPETPEETTEETSSGAMPLSSSSGLEFVFGGVANQQKPTVSFGSSTQTSSTPGSVSNHILVEGSPKQPRSDDLVARFKPEAGSWECDTCMVRNDGDKIQCAACGTAKGGENPTQAQQSSGQPKFLFGAGPPSSSVKFSFGFQGSADNGQKPRFSSGETSSTPGSVSNQFHVEASPKEIASDDLVARFKPEVGSWECDTCVVRNDGDKIQCAACGTAKGGENPTQAQQSSGQPKFLFGAGPPSSSVKFSFGFQGSADNGQKPRFSSGETSSTPGSVSNQFHVEASPKEIASDDLVARFKPEVGSWECDTCVVRNDGDKIQCAACGTAKGGENPTQAQQSSGQPKFLFGAGPPSSSVKFSFGFQGSADNGQKPRFSSGETSSTPGSVSNQILVEGSPKEPALDDFVARFKPEVGSWECDTCMVRNDGDKIQCAACGTAKGGENPTQARQSSGQPKFLFGAGPPSSSVKFSFGFQGSADNGQKPRFSSGETSSTPGSVSNQILVEARPKEPALDDFVARFKPETGSWECDTCLVRNGGDKIQCAACGTAKGGENPRQVEQSKSKDLFSVRADSSCSTSGFLFGFRDKGDSGEEKATVAVGSASQTLSTTATLGFKFAVTHQEEASVGEKQDIQVEIDKAVSLEESANEKDKHSLESQLEEVPQAVQHASGNNDELRAHHEGEIPKDDDNVQASDISPKPERFLFGSESVSSLSFQSVAASSLKTSPFDKTTPVTSAGFVGAGSKLFTPYIPGEDTGTTGDDTDGPHFEPVIPLPDKIEVKTGEEGEEVLFSHRAKLYRFVADDKQWKDRGVGDIKLLKNKESERIRVLMRRDQVKKLCANHQITEDMRLQPNAGSDRSWVWSTLADFSEQECRAEQLAVRFKTEEIANQFKEKFEECQEMLKQQKPEAPKGDLTENPLSTFQKPEAPIGDLTENPPSTFQKPEAPNGNTTENPPLTLQTPETPKGDLTEHPPSTFQKPEAPNGNTTENPSLTLQTPETPKGDLTEHPPSTFQKPELLKGYLTEHPPSTFQKPEAPNGNTTENPPLTLQTPETSKGDLTEHPPSTFQKPETPTGDLTENPPLTLQTPEIPKGDLTEHPPSTFQKPELSKGDLTEHPPSTFQKPELSKRDLTENPPSTFQKPEAPIGDLTENPATYQKPEAPKGNTTENPPSTFQKPETPKGDLTESPPLTLQTPETPKGDLTEHPPSTFQKPELSKGDPTDNPPSTFQKPGAPKGTLTEHSTSTFQKPETSKVDFTEHPPSTFEKPETPKGDLTENPPLIFQPQTGSWECDSCMVRNNSDNIGSLACGTHKPGENLLQSTEKSSFQFSLSTTSREKALGDLTTLNSEAGLSFINESSTIEYEACSSPKPEERPSGAEQAVAKAVVSFGADPSSSLACGLPFIVTGERAFSEEKSMVAVTSWSQTSCVTLRPGFNSSRVEAAFSENRIVQVEKEMSVSVQRTAYHEQRVVDIDGSSSNALLDEGAVALQIEPVAWNEEQEGRQLQDDDRGAPSPAPNREEDLANIKTEDDTNV